MRSHQSLHTAPAINPAVSWRAPQHHLHDGEQRFRDFQIILVAGLMKRNEGQVGEAATVRTPDVWILT